MSSDCLFQTTTTEISKITEIDDDDVELVATGRHHQNGILNIPIYNFYDAKT